MERAELKQILNERFIKEELNTLCFELGIDYRKFTSHFLKDRVSELLQVLEKKELLPDLIRYVKRERAFLFDRSELVDARDDPEIVLTADDIQRADRVDLLYTLGSQYQFSYEQIQSLHKDLDLGELGFSNKSQFDVVRDMIMKLEDNGRLPDLRQRLMDHYSDVNPIRPYKKPFVKPVAPEEPLAALIFEQMTLKEIDELTGAFTMPFPSILNAAEKAVVLVHYIDRCNEFPEFAELLSKKKPEIAWLEHVERFRATRTHPSSFEEQIAYHLNESELKVMIFNMNLNHENFVEPEHKKSVRNLLLYCAEHEIEDTLLEYLKDLRPLVGWRFIDSNW